MINPPVSQRLADAYCAYLSAKTLEGQVSAWAVFRALCQKENLEPVSVAKQLNPWKKSL